MNYLGSDVTSCGSNRWQASPRPDLRLPVLRVTCTREQAATIEDARKYLNDKVEMLINKQEEDNKNLLSGLDTEFIRAYSETMGRIALQYYVSRDTALGAVRRLKQLLAERQVPEERAEPILTSMTTLIESREKYRKPPKVTANKEPDARSEEVLNKLRPLAIQFALKWTELAEAHAALLSALCELGILHDKEG